MSTLYNTVEYDKRDLKGKLLKVLQEGDLWPPVQSDSEEERETEEEAEEEEEDVI